MLIPVAHETYRLTAIIDDRLISIERNAFAHVVRTALTNVVSWEDRNSTWLKENHGSKLLSCGMWL